jgi:hypothetical protein
MLQQTLNQKDGLAPKPVVSEKVAIARLAIGLLQGVILYFLYDAVKTARWPATEEYLFVPLALASLIMPVILISSLGHLGKKQVAIWIFVVVAVLGGLGFYDVWRGAESHRFWFRQGNEANRIFPSVSLFLCAGAGFFIAHSLVVAGVLDKRRIAGYPTYFETAWMLYVQITFSKLFICALWLVLWLGASLFMLLKLDFLEYLLQEPWFLLPVGAFAFSCAFHITDVRPEIARGIRALLLVLLSWILPIATLIVVGFLLSLAWTGLSPLWETRHATLVLLSSAAVLIILINAAFQNGQTGSSVAWPVRFSARGAALSLLPIAAIGIYALGLRVRDYGWTTDRIIAAACLLVTSCYALGYAWAAFRKTGWLDSVASTNVANAFVILAVLIALFSPITDPARLSVNHQMTRLQTGKVSAEKFDFDYLGVEGVRFGLAALEQLRGQSEGADAVAVRAQAERTLRTANQRTSDSAMQPVLTSNINVWPKSANLPASFLQEKWNEHEPAAALLPCLTTYGSACDAYLIDVNSDGKPEVLLVASGSHRSPALMMEGEDGHWAPAGSLPAGFADCEELLRKLQTGDFRLIKPRVNDLEIAGERIEIQRGDLFKGFKCTPLR